MSMHIAWFRRRSSLLALCIYVSALPCLVSTSAAPPLTTTVAPIPAPRTQEVPATATHTATSVLPAQPQPRAATAIPVTPTATVVPMPTARATIVPVASAAIARTSATPSLAAATPAPAPSGRSAPVSASPMPMGTATAAIRPQSGAGLSQSISGAPVIPSTALNQTATYTLKVDVSTTLALAWNLTITSTTFKTGGAAPKTLPTNATRITAVSGACSGVACVPPTNIISYPVAVPAGTTAPTAVKYFDSTAALLETFTITATMQTTVPPTASVGTYSSTITVDIFSGP